jgi:hypothetical protein
MRWNRWEQDVRVLLALAGGSVAVGACAGRSAPCVPCAEADLGESDPPEIASIAATVENVQVGRAGGSSGERTFQLSAWYLDAAQRVISGRFDPFVWELDPAEGYVSPLGLVTLNFSSGSDATVRVTSPDGTLADAVVLKRWLSPTAAGAASDVVEAGHGPKFPPSAVFLEERQADGTCTWGTARAFVGLVAVGAQNKTPCSLSLLSANHAMVYRNDISNVQWTKPFQPTLASPRPLKVRVFIAVTGRTASQLSGFPLSDTDQLVEDVAAGAEAQAKVDVTLANMLFEANRTGIHIDADFEPLDLSISDLGGRVGADPFSCKQPRTVLTEFDPANPTAPFEYDPAAINVYYVDWIDYPTDPLHPGARGVHCHYVNKGLNGPVIYVSYTKHSTITLAHEIGHALGLKDEEERLGSLNLMHNLLPDGPLGADARSRLTVGQVFRMNVWDGSWMAKLPSAVTRVCRTSNPCPAMTFDAR